MMSICSREISLIGNKILYSEVVHGGVYASFFNELVVRALLLDAVFGKYYDSVCIANGRKAVGNCNCRAALCEFGKRFLHVVLAFVIEG